MKQTILLAIVILSLCVVASAQSSPSQSAGTSASATTSTGRTSFRPTRDQVSEAQTKLKAAGLYSGEATGRYNSDTRSAIRKYQKDNGLRSTGTLNRVTLEKLGISLTESQQAIPANPADSASAAKEPEAARSTSRRTIFRATKEQIISAQRLLKEGGMYDGTETGKLSPETRAGLKKYQEANGLKVTGTLNAVTLQKMGIELTEKQQSDIQAEAN